MTIAPDVDVDTRITDLADKLTLEQQVQLLTGADMWSTVPIEEIGLGRMVLSDGPSGVRGEDFDERDHSISLPSSTALAATWSAETSRRYGQVLGQEARRKGVHVVLGPTINLHRSPLGGRHFECMSEDPRLTASLAAAYVTGVQSMNVGATPKHYIANDAETDRLTADSVVAERPLRELYLAAFEEAVTDAQAWLIMSSYNSINGTTASENDLLETPLSTEWGFDGVVVSDWTGVRSTEAAANAHQDLAMPGPIGPWGEKLVAAVREGHVSAETIRGKVVRILRLAARVGVLEGYEGEAADQPTEIDGAAFAREVAVQGSVLVKNDNHLLPLEKTTLKRVAVVGHNAQEARTQGGGSAMVLPRRTVSPVEGLQAALPDAEVTYVRGAKVAEGIQAFPRDELRNPVSGAQGVRITYFDEQEAEITAEDRLASQFIWLGSGMPAGTASLKVQTVWTAPSAGTHHLGFATVGEVKFSVDGTELYNDTLRDDLGVLGAAFFAPPSLAFPVETAAGQQLVIEVEYRLEKTGGILLTALLFGEEAVVPDPEVEIAEAVEVARNADAAVVVVGTNSAIESEGFDRENLDLPGHQNRLVEAVAAVNPRTVVVVNSGSPVLMPWRDSVDAILLGWFGGQEFGSAVADILLGVQEPGGRLPTSWPAAIEDVPVLNTTPVDGKVEYSEGLHIGYRAWLRSGVQLAFPFGYGLGYTSFTLGAPEAPATAKAGDDVVVRVPVTNTGSRTGREVVQVYLSRTDSAIERPVRWLAGWADITLDAGNTGTASVSIPARSFAHYDDGWQTESGTFRVLVGRHVQDEFQTLDVKVSA
ncbi:glycoside hydrolase family 3 C-terminal domain-containing protein [Arthrobacter tecti]